MCSNKRYSKKLVDTTVRVPVSNLPGITDGEVIASSPNIIRENSSVSLEIKKKFQYPVFNNKNN